DHAFVADVMGCIGGCCAHIVADLSILSHCISESPGERRQAPPAQPATGGTRPAVYARRRVSAAIFDSPHEGVSGTPDTNQAGNRLRRVMMTGTSTGTVQPHNERAAAVWGAGGKDYDRISRGIADSIEHCVLRL